MMKQRVGLVIFIICILAAGSLRAQWESVRMEGEIGLSLGAAHYFGDLNPEGRLNRPKLAFGAFYRKQFGNYIGVRIAAHFAQLGYSDIYYKSNEFQQRRNLSFNSNIFELGLQGDFNFFKFIPGDIYHSFTPYITFGAGIFNYDPYTYLKYNGVSQKYFLRPLGTEGQGHPNYPDRKPYSTMAFSFPIGVGVKYAINDRINIGGEIVYRYTTTDYLDDVSKTYVDPAIFPKLNNNDSPAFLLQDRSYETGDRVPIGYKDGLPNQRGFEFQRDQFIFAEITLSLNLTSYRCPKAD